MNFSLRLQLLNESLLLNDQNLLKHSAATISTPKLIIHLKSLLSSKHRDRSAEPFLFLHSPIVDKTSKRIQEVSHLVAKPRNVYNSRYFHISSCSKRS